MVEVLRVLLALLLLAGPAAAGCEAPGLDLGVVLDRPAPWRVTLEEAGSRLVLDARGPTAPKLDRSLGPCVRGVAARPTVAGWTATAIDLGARYKLASAVLRGDTVAIRLTRLGPLPAAATEPEKTSAPSELPLIVLDPGHGGIDAGAVRHGLEEKTLTLAYARALSEALIRTGRFRVVLTRTDDRYLSLAERLAFAREKGAAAFLSLHADALDHGEARGAAVFTLSTKASDAAAAALVAIHDRADLLVGQDLGGAGDGLTGVILDLARSESAPRSKALARALINALDTLPDALRKHAMRSANFGVLKSPDIPSALVELGFLSDKGDRKHLEDPAWRTAAVDALRDGLVAWADADAAAAGLRRK